MMSTSLFGPWVCFFLSSLHLFMTHLSQQHSFWTSQHPFKHTTSRFGCAATTSPPFPLPPSLFRPPSRFDTPATCFYPQATHFQPRGYVFPHQHPFSTPSTCFNVPGPTKGCRIPMTANAGQQEPMTRHHTFSSPTTHSQPPITRLQPHHAFTTPSYSPISSSPSLFFGNACTSDRTRVS